MARRLTIGELLIQEGFSSEELLIVCYEDCAAVPALCREECMVEQDGECEHGHPSVFLALGLI